MSEVQFVAKSNGQKTFKMIQMMVQHPEPRMEVNISPRLVAAGCMLSVNVSASDASTPDIEDYLPVRAAELRGGDMC